MSNIIGNSIEDFIDDLSTSLVHRELKEAFGPLLSSLNADDNVFNDALASALSTLQYGIASSVLMYIQNQVVPYLYKRATVYYTYLIAGKVTRAIAKKVKSSKSFRAKKLGIGLLSDTTVHRIEKAKIANDMITHLDNTQLKYHQIQNDTKNSITKSTLGAKFSDKDKYVHLYTQKTRTGTWTKSNEDKELYIKAVGQLPAGASWSKMVDKLNTYSEFAVSLEDKILNLAQVQLDTLTAEKIRKLK